MKLVDSHAHVDGAEFDSDRDAVLALARTAGVAAIVVVGTGPSLERIARAPALAEREPDIWAAVGVHPHDAAHIQPDWWPRLEERARHPRVVAVGETGLDYHYDHSPRDVQGTAFREHVRLARRVGKPVVCHVRSQAQDASRPAADPSPPPFTDAHADTVTILREEGPTEGVIHCFTGGPADAAAYVAIGMHVSFSGIATFRTAGDIRAAMAVVPLDRLLIETDCPFLAPIPMRGKRNEPAYLLYTAELVAREKGIPLADLAKATADNAVRLFGLHGT